MANSERKGPHKSMHCKFCKPPGAVPPEKFTGPQMETKTRVHLVHEAADLKLLNIRDEPNVPFVEYEACTCILEGDNPCPKCVPDKDHPPKKKKICRCPKGAKPHPSTFNETTIKKQKEVKEDDEFWWEKYDREHDALAKETWAAYMAQRKKEKKLEKCQKREKEALMVNKMKGCPAWFQKLSCQQMIYVEYLSTAIRLDSDENITDRTLFVLGGIGLYPRPSKKILTKCIRFCHYNAIQFLSQLHMLIKDKDPFSERDIPARAKYLFGEVFTWNEKLIMNSLCYLEFPSLLRELMDRLPQLPRPEMLPQIPYPVFSQPAKTKYESPYDEPIWQDRLNWVEKQKIDRLNRCRLFMETKRVKIPALALIRRPSLIDARPPFLSLIEANERAARRLAKEKVVKVRRKRPIPTFDSAVDVTAIAGIEASEISTTDKADTDDICVFLREPKEESLVGEVEEEPDFPPEKEVRFSEESKEDRLKLCCNFDEYSEEEGELIVEDIPFKTPPKTESGKTIGSPCLPPDTTPAPPATHFERGKRELDIINKEICGFYPFVTPSAQTVKGDVDGADEEVELNLRYAAAKLKKYATQKEEEVSDEKSQKKKKGKSKKKQKGEKKTHKKKRKTSQTPKAPTVIEMPGMSTENEEEEKEEEVEKEVDDTVQDDDLEFDEKGQVIIKLKIDAQKSKNVSKKESEISDSDPDSEDEWSTRFPCPPDTDEGEDEQPKKRKRKTKRRGKSWKRKSQKKSIKPPKFKDISLKKKLKELKDEKKKKATSLENTESETTPKSNSPDEKKEEGENEEGEKESEKDNVEVFTGDVEPLVQKIIQDLADEGYYSAAFPLVEKHPEVEQLIAHLKGKFVNKELRESLIATTKARWNQMSGIKKVKIRDLGVSLNRLERATWNDKKWVSRLAKKKLNQFYYLVANSRAQYGIDFYDTLYQSFFGTERFLKIYYAYMISKYEDAILRGIF